MSKRTIRQIAEEWRLIMGDDYRGRYEVFKIIPAKKRKYLMRYLLQTLLDEGYNEEDLKSSTTRLAIVEQCVGPDTPNTNPKGKRNAQFCSGQAWDEVTKIHFAGSFSTPIEREKMVIPEPPTPSNGLPELEPKTKEDMIAEAEALKAQIKVNDKTIDQTKFSKTLLNEDFINELKSLGVDPSRLK